MAYRRRRYARRRYARRGRTLTTRNIFVRRSSVAQAGQIAALRRRVNKVYKICKPERKVRNDANVGQDLFDSGATGHTSFVQPCINIPSGTNDWNRVGDRIYRRDTWYLQFAYNMNSDTGYANGVCSGVTIRVIVGRYKVPHAMATNVEPSAPNLDSLIQHYATTGPEYLISSCAPLADGISKYFVIDRDFTFKMTTDNCTRDVKVKTKRYACTFDSDSKQNNSFIAITVSGLNYVIAGTNEQVGLIYTRKTVFTDA